MKRVYLVAVIVALFTAGATYLFAQNIMEKTTIENAEKANVLFALEDVPAGMAITSENVDKYFAVREIVKDYITPQAIPNPAGAVGKVTTRAIHSGEQLSEFAFATEGSDDIGLSYNLKEGEVAYTLKADTTEGVDGYVRVGDTINIVSYYEVVDNDGNVDTQKSKATMEFQDLYVLKVGTYEELDLAKTETNGDVKTYVSITVKTTREEAEKLYTMEHQSKASENGDQNFKVILNAKIDSAEADKE